MALPLSVLDDFARNGMFPVGHQPAGSADAVDLVVNTPDTKTGLAGVCVDCGQAYARTGPRQKYCEDCSRKRRSATCRRYNATHKSTPEQIKKRRERKVSAAVARGTAISDSLAHDIDWVPPGRVYARSISFAVPFSYRMSKNSVYSMRSEGHVALRRMSKAIRDSIEATARQRCEADPFVQGKVWVDMLIQKPNNRGDAINVVDLVCDGIKRGVGVDDRWFCIGCVDWQIVKTDPQLIIRVSQENREHVHACSYCGRLLPLSCFASHRSQPLGVGRECKECTRVERA